LPTRSSFAPTTTKFDGCILCGSLVDGIVLRLSVLEVLVAATEDLEVLEPVDGALDVPVMLPEADIVGDRPGLWQRW
jgi:hypothetical protein